MKITYYRYGTEETIFGNFRYCIQKKVWYGWKTILTFNTKGERDSVITQLKTLPNNIFT